MNHTSVNIQGNIISSEIIDKIRTEEQGYYQQPSFFGKDHAIRDEIGNAWINAKALWNIFKNKRDRVKEHETGTTETRKSWIEPFLAELDFAATKTTAYQHPETGKRFDISHRDEELGGFPIHLVSFKQNLDKPAQEGKASPHALVQEYLNSVEQTYALVSNGIFLRLLRDSSRIVRISYYEFNLEKMMEEDLFSDFAILYRTLHASRFQLRTDLSEGCIFENYHLQSLESGSRLRENLSIAVINGLVGYPNGLVVDKNQPYRLQTGLANGFIQHRNNQQLREDIQSGRLSADSFYAELLRLIYRFLFLIVTEERDLVYPELKEDDPFREEIARKKQIYYRYYSIERLRKLAGKLLYMDGSKDDLWEGLKSTFLLFENPYYGEKLGLRALASGIFAPHALQHLTALRLDNRTLIDTISGLCYFVNQQTKQTVRVNYSDLDVEEFGSVYEGLLEYSPAFEESHELPKFRFREGTLRQSSGSHYTPEELCKPLIQHSLEHVIEECLQSVENLSSPNKPRVAATPVRRSYTSEERTTLIRKLLQIRVCDVACGSGHLLLSAARRIALEVARLMTGEDQPNPVAMRQAMRQVIKHCIYGVDKNPLAVELCKVALWLEAHNPGEPLNFLDHHIKHGDSILGLARQEELMKGIPDEAFKVLAGDDKEVAKRYRTANRKGANASKELGLFDDKVNQSLTELISEFEAFDQLPENTPKEVAAKEKKYRILVESDGMKQLKTLADLQVAQFFLPKTEENEPKLVTNSSYYGFLRGERIPFPIEMAAVEFFTEHYSFHWFLEFPEIFIRGGFDCILGNPPFLGGQKLSGTYGSNFLEYLKYAYQPIGAVDLVTYFFRRIFNLLRPNGFLSLVSTNTIAQGSAREGGLDVICQQQEGTINHAFRSMRWPGEAAVEISLVSIYKGIWKKEFILDHKKVERITPYLDDAEVMGNPYPLRQNAGKSFQGSIVLGKGFVLEPEQAQALITKDARNREVLFPYLNGEDLNNDPQQQPSRWVINFFDWSEERARSYPDCFEIVERLVKPERQRWKLDKDGNEIVGTYALRKPLPQKWWIYGEKRPALYKTISKVDQVMVINRYTKYLTPVFSNKGVVFSDSIVVMSISSNFEFGVLSSSLHEVWAWKNSSTMGASTLRYSASKAFETFPFPKEKLDNIEEKSISIIEQRKSLMQRMNIGLTELYNLVHNRTQQIGEIIRFLQKELDEIVLSAYGWEDIQLKHSFYDLEYLPKNDRIRFTIHPDARKEILKRLLKLNHQIYSEEIKTIQVKKSPKKKKQADDRQRDLF